MHVAVIGAGAAGLGAALRLREEGHNVTVFDKNADVGGRCRTFFWHGQWLISGAAAFVGSEDNLIDQAKALGIYSPSEIVDQMPRHRWNIYRHDKPLIELASFGFSDILTCGAMPFGEKAGLALTLPMLLKQMARYDRHDPTVAADLDTINACAYFREKSPFFADYILEPIMQVFTGFDEDDFSLAFIAWMFGASTMRDNGWWDFKERGVGRLTHEMGLALERQQAGTVRTSHVVKDVAETENGVTVQVLDDRGAPARLNFDAAIMALPGSMVAAANSTLATERRPFFEQVEYVGHYICYAVIRFPDPEVRAMRRVLPTIEGFSVVSNFTISALADGSGNHLIYCEIKGDACIRMQASSDASIMEELLGEIAQVATDVASATLIDSYVQRNDIAISRRHVGYTKALKSYLEMPETGRIAYAGDYLLSSTVGQAHYTGLRAADRLLARLG